jgi:TonB dependent receptor
MCSSDIIPIAMIIMIVTAHPQSSTQTADLGRAVARPLEMSPLLAEGQTPSQSNLADEVAKLLADQEYGEQLPLIRRAHVEPWALSVDAEYFATDNVALASTGELEDFYLRTGVNVKYTNRIIGDWFMNAGLDAHSLLHEEYDVLDFLLLKTEASLLYRLPWISRTFMSLGYSGYWMSASDFSTEAFRNHSVTFGIQHAWQISRQMQVIYGLSVDYSLFAFPIIPQRHEYAGYLGYQFRLTDHWILNASYRAGWYPYPEVDRDDWNHVVALTLAYQITPEAKLSLSASQAWNRSSYSFFSYDSRTVGLSASFTLSY